MGFGFERGNLFFETYNLCFFLMELIKIFPYLSSIFLILFNLKLLYHLFHLLDLLILVIIQLLEVYFLVDELHIDLLYLALTLYFI